MSEQRRREWRVDGYMQTTEGGTRGYLLTGSSLEPFVPFHIVEKMPNERIFTREQIRTELEHFGAGEHFISGFLDELFNESGER